MPENRTPIAEIGSGLYLPNTQWKTTNEGIRYMGNVWLGTGSLLITPSAVGNNLVILGGTQGGLTIEATQQASLYFADATDNNAGAIVYYTNSEVMQFRVNDRTAVQISSVGTIEMTNSTTTTPTVDIGASGAIFISGGALWYKSHGAKYTQLAAN